MAGENLRIWLIYRFAALQNREEIRIIGAVMVEGNQDNILRSSDGLLEKDNDGSAPEDSVPICPKCLRECDPRTYYCPHCDSNEAIDPLASYMPFVDIRFECGFYGKAWRTIWYNKEASAALKLLCLVLIIYFAPILLIVGLPLLLIEKIKDARLK